MTHPKVSLTHRTITGLFWMAGGKGASTILDVVVLAVLARLLTPHDFGIVGAAMVITRFSSVFSRLGLGPALVQLPTLEPRHERTAFATSLGLGLVLAGVIWAIAPAVAAFFKIDGVEPVLRVLAWTFPLKGLSAVAESLLQRELRFRWLATLQLKTFGIAYAPVGIGLAFAGFGVWALVAAKMVQSVLRTSLLLIAQRPPLRPWPERKAFQELVYFGGGFTVAKLANYLAQEGDYLVVGRWLGAAALGFYTRAYKLMAAPASLFGGMLDDVLFPAMARVQTAKQRLALAYRRGVALVALVMLPTSAVLTVLAPELVLVVLGSQWGNTILPLQILAVGLLFRTSYKISDSLARATGAVYRRAWRQGIYAALVFGGAWVGQHWGLSGVAFGVLGAITINFLLMAALSLSVTEVSWGSFVRAHRPAFALTLVVGLLVWGVATLLRVWSLPPLAVLLIASAITAAVSLLAVRVVPRLLLGRDGLWMLEMLRSMVSTRLATAGRSRDKGEGRDAGLDDRDVETAGATP
jgi:PST family polysaccharide transporter